jgi:hypothetical protein
MNRKGIIVAEMLVIGVGTLMAAMFTRGIIDTASSGVLKQNVQVVACKMANGGEDACNSQYGYAPVGPHGTAVGDMK